MSLTLVVWTAKESNKTQLDSGLPVQDYLLQYDTELRKAAKNAGEIVPDDLFCGIATDIYLNDLQEPLKLDDMLKLTKEGDILHISHRPQAGLSFVAKVIIAVIAAIAVVALIPRPSIPKINGLDSGGSAESPNNRLSGQTNVARPYQAIPEIFGKIISYPDLIQPSIFEYVDNIKLVREVFCVGGGTYTFGLIRDGQTPISSIPGSSAQIYGPGTTPADLQISRESNDINGQELQGANDATRQYSGRLAFINRNSSETAANVVFNMAGYFTSTTLDLAWLLDLSANDVIQITNSSSNNGNFTVSSIILDQSTGSDRIRVSVNEVVTNETSPSITVTPSSQPVSAMYAFEASVVSNLGLDEGDNAELTNVTFTSIPRNITTSSEVDVLSLEPGSMFVVSGTSQNNGLFTVSSIASSGSSRIITVNEPTTSESNVDCILSTNSFTVSGTSSNNSSFSIQSSETKNIQISINSSVTEGTEIVTHQSFTNEDDPSAMISRAGASVVPWVGWFQLAGEMDQIWTHYQAPQGLQNEQGNTISVQIEVQTQETDQSGTPTGTIVSNTVTLRGGSIDPLFRTLKIIVPTKGFYRIRSRRVTNRFPGNAVDLIKWEDAFSVEDYTGNFGNVTLLDVRTLATNFALNSSRRQINAEVTRRLGTARSGTFVPTLVATQSFADAALYSLMAAGRPISEIDIASLYDIEQSLSENLREFNFSFDDENIDLGERVVTICNCARVFVYRDGQIWRFGREQAAPRTLMFNRRNIAISSSQNQSITQRKPNDFDGVVLRYTNPDNNRRAEVEIQIDAANQTFVEGTAPSKPSRIDLAGCRNETQARNRAHLEVRKLLFQRRRIREQVLGDGFLVDIGDRVSWVDIYDGETFDGEIRSASGNVYVTSERFLPVAGQSYVVSITDSNGNATNPVSCLPVAGQEFAFETEEAIGSDPIIANGTTIQAGSRYFIGNANDTADADFTIVSKQPNVDGRVRLEMINYDERTFEMDGSLT